MEDKAYHIWEARQSSQFSEPPHSGVSLTSGLLTTNGIAISVGTMRIELATCVIGRNANFRKVAGARDLYITACLHKVSAVDGPGRNHARPAPRFGAVSHCETRTVEMGERRLMMSSRDWLDLKLPFRLDMS